MASVHMYVSVRANIGVVEAMANIRGSLNFDIILDTDKYTDQYGFQNISPNECFAIIKS